MIAAALMIELAAFALVYFKANKHYKESIKALDKKQHPFREFYPVALYILDKLDCKYRSVYNGQLLSKLSELYGHKASRYYLKMHWANKITNAFVSAVVLTFVSAANGSISISFAAFGLAVIALVVYLTDRELDNRIKERHLMLQYEFPDFLNKLVLLVNAGMTVLRAWEKAVQDCKKSTPLYSELAVTLTEIANGRPEAEAYEAFAKRCRVKEISKFAGLVIQNLKRGNTELAAILRLQANECWEMRKSVARRLGEEASAKLMLPLALMFVGILMIVMLPAILQLRSM